MKKKMNEKKSAIECPNCHKHFRINCSSCKYQIKNEFCAINVFNMSVKNIGFCDLSINRHWIPKTSERSKIICPSCEGQMEVKFKKSQFREKEVPEGMICPNCDKFYKMGRIEWQH